MDEGKWITLKDGRRIFLKPKKIETNTTNDYMNAKLRGMAGVKAEDKEEKKYKELTEEDYAELERETDKLYNKLSEQEIRALNNYTLSNYEDINKFLAKGNITKEEMLSYSNIENIKDDIKNLDKALEKSQIKKDIVLYRGTSERYFNDKKVGDVFEFKTYSSTTAKKSIAEKFARRQTFDKNNKGYEKAILEIRTPKGAKGIYLGDKFNENGLNEYEVLLHRKTKYKMISNELVNPSHYEGDVYVQEVPYKKIIIEVVK